MMDIQRYNAELAVLAGHFPANRYAFIWDANPRLEVILPIAKFNAVYKTKIYLASFPESEPIVTPGTILRDWCGVRMTQPSRANHLLGTYNGETRMCIYSEWQPKFSLNKTAYRAAMWLHAYHCHLATGRNIECYLSH